MGFGIAFPLKWLGLWEMGGEDGYGKSAIPILGLRISYPCACLKVADSYEAPLANASVVVGIEMFTSPPMARRA